MDLYLATEDALGEAIGHRLVAETVGCISVAVSMGKQGNGFLKQKLPELITLAHSCPVLLLTDLDLVVCPAELIRKWAGKKVIPRNLLFRVAVREAEAWLLADRDSFAAFTGVPVNKVPTDPDALSDPKRALLNLVARYGKRSVQQELLPAQGSKAIQGLGYNQLLCEHVHRLWSPKHAAAVSGSLARARNRIAELSDSISK